MRRIADFFRQRVRATGTPSGPGVPAFVPGGSLSNMHQTRESIAAVFLRGQGIEIGALHQPLRVPPSVRVKYVDRMSAQKLRQHYPELSHLPLVETDIIDNGEHLTTIGDATQDFVVANHFIEHCQNPILTFQNLFRVVKPGGILYLAVPDKRFTFDVDRPCTTTEHLIQDFTQGPESSKSGHFEEWSRLVNKRTDEAQIANETQHLMNIDYSIHFHVWGASELLEFVLTLQKFDRFEFELFLRNGHESLLILRKSAE